MALVSLGGFDPTDSLLDLQRRLARMLENPTLGLNLGPSAAGVFPPVNIFSDKEGAFVLRAEVPGIAPESLEVTVEPHRLTLGGERKPGEGKGSYHRRERQFGKFSRAIQLPEGFDPGEVSADCRDGVLTLRIARNKATQPRKIEIKAK